MPEHILYNEKFYSDRRNRVIPSANIIMKLVFDLCPIDSVIDFGCGTGTWINAARSNGAKHVLGIEGNWLQDEFLDNPDLDVQKLDLSKPIKINQKFDLAISLEVGEHLPPERAESFIEDICRTSQKVLFSAAIPNQGGTGHVNEQWQQYWAKLFSKLGYRAFDVIRPKIWSNSSIPFWYRQNIILYMHEDEIEHNKDIYLSLQETKPADLDVVHPDQFKLNTNRNFAYRIEQMGFIQRLKIAAGIPKALIAAIKRRL